MPPPEAFTRLVAPAITDLMPHGWVHRQLADGRGLILVDGLDEISSRRRGATKEWIADILSSFPQSRVVVTTRPPAFPDGWLTKNGFIELDLLPMSPDDVGAFIDHWHGAVSFSETDPTKRQEVLDLSSPLKARISADKTLSELASTPLLCAMLCAMNRERREVLPSNRLALYEAAVQMLLHARDEQRQIGVEGPPLDYETKLGLLETIAFWMMQNGWSMVDRWRLEELVESEIGNFTRIEGGTQASLIVDHLLLRSGLIRSPIEGKIDFIHNAFKEYLCARGCVSSDRFGFLEDQLDKEAWREVAVLSAAMTDDVRRSEFIRNLLTRGDKGPSKRSMYHLLAVRCLETCTHLQLDVQEEIKDRLKNLKAPKNLSEARSLSSAGELAIPLVRKGSGKYARTAAACVRTLRLIGTEEALEALEEYASDKRATVVKEILAAWPYFDQIDYAKRVLSKTKGIRGHLYLENVNYLPAVRYLNGVNSLYVGVRGVELNQEQYEGLNAATQLTSLTIANRAPFSFNGIANLKSLRSLNIGCSEISDVELISDFLDLEYLQIQISPGSDLHLGAKPLPESLIAVELRATNILSEANVFEHCELVHATLWGIEARLLESMICQQRKLRVFDFSSNESCPIIETLDCDELERIYVRNAADLEHFGSFQGVPNLRALILNKSESLTDLAALTDLTKLETLAIFGASNLTDVSSIAELPNLKRVALECSPDADFGALASLQDVEVQIPDAHRQRAKQAGLKQAQGWGRVQPYRYFHNRLRAYR